jgi:hypothetical protein
MGREPIFIKMGISILEIGNLVKNKDLGKFFFMMDHIFKGNGKETNLTDLEKCNIQMEIYMKETFFLELKKEMEFIYIKKLNQNT